MAKHKKTQTPQEMYKARKQREEDEKNANLPPGLINHGNTCFMNSTLQGLIATRLLYDLVHFTPVPPTLHSAMGAPIMARRSPQLTNGHDLGGQYEQPWVESMPLGDIFIATMRKAWGFQDARRRESMSPKEILTTIGHKYDQYLDFRQQDAHEFLRHMLDAMRMEELDVIKKRQPPPPKEKERRGRRTHALPPPSSSDPSIPIPSPAPTLDALAPEDKLESFVDMLFGGRLASILVCEKCKKISVTHEEFNDLSLSIKPEDYVKARKRDRIRKLADKLRILPPGMQRSSSVPASPLRRSSEEPPPEEPPENEDPRRNSFDHAGAEGEARNSVREMAVESLGITLPSVVTEDEGVVEGGDEKEVSHVSFSESTERKDDEGSQVKDKGKDKKEKDDDAWAKLSRRISVSMKMGRRDKDSRPPSRMADRGRKAEIKEAARENKNAESESSAHSSLAPAARTGDAGSDVGYASDNVQGRGPSPSPVASPLPASPLLASTRLPNIRRTSAQFVHKRAKSPAAPKLSHAESSYLRHILADVHPSSGNPLAMLQHAFAGTGTNGVPSSPSLSAQALWAKLGHMPGIEECLRMFTAVEIMEGDNMVGCHRCWKIANGTYRPRRKAEVDENEAGSESEQSEADEEKRGKPVSVTAAESAQGATVKASEDALLSSPDLSSSGRVSPASASVLSTTVTMTSSLIDDTASISSAPTTVASAIPLRRADSSPADDKRPAKLSTGSSTFGGLPIPLISTTAPESPHSAPASTRNMERSRSADALPQHWTPGATAAAASLLTPRARRRARSKKARKDGAEDSSDSSDDSYDESGSDSSADNSVYSDVSSLASPLASPAMSPNASVEKLLVPTPPSSSRAPSKQPSPPKVPRSKQVIPRRMYKRYLISTPPPILVVHLKRFQQTSKTYSVSFTSGFKKLDDFVAFPEYLDLAPYLAPKKEEFGLGKKGPAKLKVNGKAKNHEHCMYRLYAVVVHIGNMLGGHYIAYTALPSSNPPPASVSGSDYSSTPTLGDHPSHILEITTEHHHKHSRQWAYISDTIVRLTTLEEVLKAKAYICMYERI
ncbi:Ubiquitin carboxyl-terminal hydrolase 16 [Grifola frondosa]|uniref:Ubiquitin carboxyl-terminal hydrolase 16 n=1 Tax=Grifola frondosa TaxID=5627 RepID=A0A1C7MND0_GRIFR|nr:Ubiquitin carboxyl-terminal hydrolase 16 [Grifola frondosa]